MHTILDFHCLPVDKSILYLYLLGRYYCKMATKKLGTPDNNRQ